MFLTHVAVPTFGLPAKTDPVKLQIGWDGQSNEPGRKFIEQVSQPEHDKLIGPYPNVTIREREATFQTPPIVLYDSATGDGTQLPVHPDWPLQPRPYALPTPNMGAHLSAGHYIDAAYPKRFNFVCNGVGATTLATEWNPTGNWPASGLGNQFHLAAAYHRQAELDGLGQLSCMVWIQGESDALDATQSANYRDNLRNYILQFRAQQPHWANLPFVINRLSNLYDDHAGGANLAVIRAAQEWVCANVPFCYMVDSDNLILDSGLHFTPDSYVALGYRIGPVILRVLGIVQPPTVNFATRAVDLMLSCTDLSSDPNVAGFLTQWLWTFGDGTSSTDQNPTHVYRTPGQYNLSVTVTNNNGSSASLSTVITVASPSWTVDGAFQKAFPANSTEWNTLIAAHGITFGGVTPTAPNAGIWGFQDAASPVVDANGAKNLSAVNAPTFRKTHPGVSRFFVGSSGAATSQNVNNVTMANISSTDVFILGVGTYTTTATNREQMSWGGAAVNALEVAGGTNKARKRTGTPAASTVNDYADGTPHIFGCLYSVSQLRDELHTEKEVLALTHSSQSDFGTISGGVVTYSFCVNTDTASETKWCYGCGWSGYSPTVAEIKHLYRALGYQVTVN